MPDDIKFCTACGGSLSNAQPDAGQIPQPLQNDFGQAQAYTPQQAPEPPQPLNQPPQPLNQQDGAFGQQHAGGQQGFGQQAGGQQPSFMPGQSQMGTQRPGGTDRMKGMLVAVVIFLVAFFGSQYLMRSCSGPSSSGSSGSSGVVSGGSSGSSSESPSDTVIPPNYVDDYDNVTCLALMELDGDDLSYLLDELGYDWSSSSVCYLRQSDMAAVAAMDADDNLLSQRDMERLDPGAAGEATIYINSVAGYDNIDDALEGVAGGEIVGQLSKDDSIVAVLEDSSGNYFFISGEAHGDGTFDLAIWNEDSIAMGEFTENFGVEAHSVAEVWEILTGEKI